MRSIYMAIALPLLLTPAAPSHAYFIPGACDRGCGPIDAKPEPRFPRERDRDTSPAPEPEPAPAPPPRDPTAERQRLQRELSVKGIDAYRNGQYDLAIKYFTDALRYWPDDRQAQLNLSLAKHAKHWQVINLAVESRNWRLALSSLSEAIRNCASFCSNDRRNILLTWQSWVSGRIAADQAQQVWESRDWAKAARDCDAAASLFAQALRYMPGDRSTAAWLNRMQGFAAFARGLNSNDPALALGHYKEALGHLPNNADVLRHIRMETEAIDREARHRIAAAQERARIEAEARAVEQARRFDASLAARVNTVIATNAAPAAPPKVTAVIAPSGPSDAAYAWLDPRWTGTQDPRSPAEREKDIQERRKYLTERSQVLQVLERRLREAQRLERHTDAELTALTATRHRIAADTVSDIVSAAELPLRLGLAKGWLSKAEFEKAMLMLRKEQGTLHGYIAARSEDDKQAFDNSLNAADELHQAAPGLLRKFPPEMRESVERTFGIGLAVLSLINSERPEANVPGHFREIRVPEWYEGPDSVLKAVGFIRWEIGAGYAAVNVAVSSYLGVNAKLESDEATLREALMTTQQSAKKLQELVNKKMTEAAADAAASPAPSVP